MPKFQKRHYAAIAGVLSKGKSHSQDGQWSHTSDGQWSAICIKLADMFANGNPRFNDLLQIALYWCKMKVQSQLRSAASLGNEFDPTMFDHIDVQNDACRKAAILALEKAGADNALIQQALEALRNKPKMGG